MGIIVPSLTITDFFDKHTESVKSKKIDNLIQNILNQVEKLSTSIDILEIFFKLEPSLYELQKEAFLYLTKELEQIEPTIYKEEVEELRTSINQNEDHLNELKSILSEVFEVIYLIQKSKPQFTSSDIELARSAFSETLTYKHIDFLKDAMPNFSIDLITQLIRYGLLLDFLLVVSRAILDDKINFTPVERLRKLIKESIEEYAAVWVQLGTWNPEKEKETQLIRNIKIKVAYHSYHRNKSVA